MRKRAAVVNGNFVRPRTQESKGRGRDLISQLSAVSDFTKNDVVIDLGCLVSFFAGVTDSQSAKLLRKHRKSYLNRPVLCLQIIHSVHKSVSDQPPRS